MKIKETTLVFSAIVIALLNFPTVTFSQDKSSDKNIDAMLCMGDHWTESQGKEFPEKMRQTYATAAAWKKRAKQMRTHILKGAGLEKLL